LYIFSQTISIQSGNYILMWYQLSFWSSNPKIIKTSPPLLTSTMAEIMLMTLHQQPANLLRRWKPPSIPLSPLTMSKPSFRWHWTMIPTFISLGLHFFWCKHMSTTCLIISSPHLMKKPSVRQLITKPAILTFGIVLTLLCCNGCMQLSYRTSLTLYLWLTILPKHVGITLLPCSMTTNTQGLCNLKTSLARPILRIFLPRRLTVITSNISLIKYLLGIENDFWTHRRLCRICHLHPATWPFTYLLLLPNTN